MFHATVSVRPGGVGVMVLVDWVTRQLGLTGFKKNPSQNCGTSTAHQEGENEKKSKRTGERENSHSSTFKASILPY